jgi:hypothetical protein
MKKKAFATGFTSATPLTLIALLISLKIHYFIIVWIIYIVFSLIGASYGASYIRNGNVNKNWLNQLFWSNAATWLIPPLGFFTSASTAVINRRNQGDDYSKFRWIANFCFLASIINATALAGLLFQKW